ncbi:ATP-dependent helicase HrpB [Bosea sp. (in: a-proteobacteria)]|uniref:ATP-dependent helicase HrpB n=1 Tax=Bosea sp. (in: a-proteobacteria) TaxID=1871050 RepID=UPI00260F4E5A|nr:ATP-dependent helicase HrpB [Bosea sp. (in: a-proteobacteria)]MCO5090235.1 ATP-dependent helicase HrpB [Bosea sp. (in: a-proteobacteria)]
MRAFAQPLPIDAVLGDLAAALRARPNAVLVAPPGAGKTTRVPLALLDEPWTKGGKLILLEPRRLAARGAANRMAETLGERLGETVGLRVRLGSRIGPRTRIEVVTEGVFVRMILDDPALEGVAAVLFDEFHERSLDADFGLALALDAQSGLREDLRLLVMSATLDGARVAKLLGDAPVIESEGRAFPVETRYRGRDPLKRIEDQVTETILLALNEQPGSQLVFLPGQGEIRRVEERLRERLRDASVEIAPLYGALDQREQDRAVLPAPVGKRKIVLATAIAETSLTIEGVRVVIDSGLARVPVYEPDIGVTRLETRRVSRAAADQRRGRAGRTGPGVCYRLWEEAATGALEAFARPEILSADLSPLLLDCAAWGVADPTRLAFLDPPPVPALKEARLLLSSIGALDADGRIAPEGRALQALPLPPRLARMVVAAGRFGQADPAADLAAVLVERGLGGDAVDLAERLERFSRERGGRAGDMRRLAEGWARMVGRGAHQDEQLSPGLILAFAYPDRVAKARAPGSGQYLLANGRGAALEPSQRLAREPFIVVAEMTGAAQQARIMAAAAIGEPEIAALVARGLAPFAIAEREEASFDRAARALRVRAVRRYGALALSERPLPVADTPENAEALAKGIAALGIGLLPWSKGQNQLRERAAFLRKAEPEAGWPDLSDEGLAQAPEAWLAPHLVGRASLAAVQAADLDSALASLLPWEMKRRLDAQAPTHFTAPTGSCLAVDYAAEAGPTISVRVQELYGLAAHPALAGGRVPLVLELLSPAHRPIQVTRDLPGFWRGSWSAVKAEMKGRYPRHPWPDDPAAAPPTTRAKPRGT